MSILNKHLVFVNEQSEFHEKMVEKFGAETFRGKLHQTTAEKFRSSVPAHKRSKPAPLPQKCGK